ncbi:N-terminal domain of NEFA-interacting nuclear protein NIP30-domain-containing protein [Cerioporus squamosus]|nr:N-terminal domain of NEFA-interacting nuclear protein NIP30-domain-containing protein [Cerioporus squamosus]
MDDAIPSISTDGVGSRFVSQNDLEAAKARRDEQWRAAYARLGQEPPQLPQEDAFDGRSLAEKLAANRAAKQEEWEERNKLGNQFRALEEDEVLFLDSILEKQREEERLRKELEGEELKNFRDAVAARENAANKAPPIGAASAATPSAPPKAKPTAAPAKKDPKKSLKGVLVKKKSKPTASEAQQFAAKEDKSKSDERTDGNEREAKRRKVSSS